jgi:hypothetical protein
MELTWAVGGEVTQSGCSTLSLVSEAGEEAGPTGEGASNWQLEDCHEETGWVTSPAEDREDVVDGEDEEDAGTVEGDSASKR